MSMHNPAMYEKFIAFQKQDALHCLQKFGQKMNWRPSASVVDLGSGDGFVTNNILKKHIPADFKELVGVDVSKEMVNYAAKTYGNEKIRFGVMDIAGKVPKDMKGAFHHAFSSFALQFVPDQEKAFSNIHELLKEDGSCLLVLMASFSHFDAYTILSKREKWRTYSNQLINIVPRYHTLKDPAAEVKRIMKDSGFKNIHVENNKSFYEYETHDSMLKMVESANLFHISPEPLKEFIKEFEEVMDDIKGAEPVESKPAVRVNYISVMAYGMK